MLEGIPFYDYVVTKDIFNEIESFENISIQITKTENNIIIQFKNTFPSNLFYYIDEDGKYYLSLLEDNLATYLKENNICEVKDNPEYQAWIDLKKADKMNWSTGLLKTNKYIPIKRIYKLWNKIIVNPDCTFDVDYIIDDEIATVPIRNAGEIIKNWIIKYRDIFRSHNPQDFIFELSAGLDSRALTWFWRYNSEQYRVYSKVHKDELPIAKEVAKRLPIGEFMTSKKGINGITVSGIGNSSKSFNDRDIFEHYAGIHHSKHLIKDVCPYLDRDFLKVYGDYPQQVKLVIQILLAEDLIDIPYMTWMDKHFWFTENSIRECKTIINKWLKINIDDLK